MALTEIKQEKELTAEEIQAFPRELVDVYYQFRSEDQDPLEGFGLALSRPPSHRTLVLVLTEAGNALWVGRDNHRDGFQATFQNLDRVQKSGHVRLWGVDSARSP